MSGSRAPAAAEHHRFFGDFTEAGYRDVLALAARSYAFARFTERPAGRHVLWRHDVDFSMHRARRLARIEADAGVVATYFLHPHSGLYNLLSRPIADIAREIADLGHDIGLHFDPGFYPEPLDHRAACRRIDQEAQLLGDCLGLSPVAVSYHLYADLDPPMPDCDVVAGMVNAYGASLRRDYSYVSDSNGVWRYRRLRDVLEEALPDRLHVLTHPEWWTPEALPPRARIQRCIDGLAAAIGRDYDRLIDGAGRPNIG